jgi:hypothetical protein
MKLFIFMLEHISLRPYAQRWNSYCQCFSYLEFKFDTLKSKKIDKKLGRWNIIHDQDVINKKIDLANHDNSYSKSTHK